jgi:endoglucanase
MNQLRKRLGRYSTVAAALVGAGISICAGPVRVADAAAPLPFIHEQGTQYLDESGKPVLLKGCNIGNWLLIELWMFGGCIQTSDQAHLFAKLDERFGHERGHQLMELYRANDITARDFDLIKSFGFNVVRLPIDYRLLQSDQPPYAIKPDAFKWVDRAVDMAEKAGIYIILDMHAVPGGQSNDQCTGESGQNKLWNNPVNEQRTIDVWHAMAEHYRNRSNVAGYDLMNEPYADHKMDVRGNLRKIMGECYTAIRSTGDAHILFFPGALGQPPQFYDDPHAAGWTNVGFTEHFYPGLFGDKVAFESHIRTLTRTIPARQKWLDRVQSPYYIGEFNPVLDATGGPRITRAYYDAFAQHGWAGTIWSYKLYKPAGGANANTWYCASNANPIPKLDLNSSTYEDFEQFFSSLSTIPLAPNQPLLTALTEPAPEPLPMSAPPVANAADLPSLLKDASFENSGTAWKLSGEGFHREETPSAVHSGKAGMVYHESSGPSELSQEIPAEPGQRYHFAIFASRADEDAKVELKLESRLDGHVVTLNSTVVRPLEIGDGGKWSPLAVDGTAIGQAIRIRIIVTPGTPNASHGTINFDDAVLQVATK